MPHVCGDEPEKSRRYMKAKYVCPTYVGMNREQYQIFRHRLRMPHVCGDEPDPEKLIPLLMQYAPRMWG